MRVRMGVGGFKNMREKGLVMGVSLGYLEKMRVFRL